MRNKNRKNNEIREVKVTKNYLLHPEGSVLIEIGNTRVICTATIEDKIPAFNKASKKGWIHAEYSMLPRATDKRTNRESMIGKVKGRTMEIQRLISRTLRSCVDLQKLGERTITIDCDVIQADGGTRTASITGGFLALEQAIEYLLDNNLIKENPLKFRIAAISVGKVNGNLMVDLDYSEDSIADVDMNVIINDDGEYIEVQGTSENQTFTPLELQKLLELAHKGIEELFLL